MTPKIDYLEVLCKDYDLAISENPRNNLIAVLSSAEPTVEEKDLALSAYEIWFSKTIYDV